MQEIAAALQSTHRKKTNIECEAAKDAECIQLAIIDENGQIAPNRGQGFDGVQIPLKIDQGQRKG